MNIRTWLNVMSQLEQVWKTQEIESTFKWWIESKCYCSVRKYLKNLNIEERDLEDQTPIKGNKNDDLFTSCTSCHKLT